MLLDIITPDTQLYSGEVTSITLPGIDGDLGILNNHAPLITTLKKGTISIIKAGGENESFETNGGIVEVLNNKVIVLAE
ncbi:ATP synthase F1 subunit epsilon [Flavobacteriales bacterium]|jgi:F-type H+-transporting ATPase subunit epsilon|nr:ATP synthase F1 subunit epsilon [Flavobacteriales bacterium]MDC0015159.1 ATP synthase F1 subunit epsilon [Flavobacteriales bacterium]MDC1352820.1 ATP synthase F1 subunit epsilon [Flavobacteriales bacterium]